MYKILTHTTRFKLSSSSINFVISLIQILNIRLTQRNSGVWGSHLNKKTFKRSDSSSNSFTEMSLKFGLDTSQVAAVNTRTSLKKRTRTFQSFTDTLGVPETSLGAASSQPVNAAFTPLENKEATENEDSDQLGSNIALVSSSIVDTDYQVGEEQEEEEEEDGLTLFPSLSLKAREGAGARPVVKQSGLRRKIDSDWLARCTGIQSERKEESEAQPSPRPPGGSERIEVTGTAGAEPKPATTGRGLSDSEPVHDKPEPAAHSSATLPATKPTPSDLNSVEQNISTANKGLISSKNKNKRKRDSESEDEDYHRSEEDEIEVKQTKSTISKADTKKGAKPRKKKAKVTEKNPHEEDEIAKKTDESQGPTALNMFALGFEEQEADKVVPIKKAQSAQERLESKVLSGKANDCFVKIDLKKKKFSRGKGGLSGAKIKRAEWKRKMDLKEGKKVKEVKCFRCGEAGHWARQCTGGKGDSLIPVEMSEEFDAGEFPSLDQARDMASGVLRLQKENSVVNSLKLFSVKQSSSQDTGMTNTRVSVIIS